MSSPYPDSGRRRPVRGRRLPVLALLLAVVALLPVAAPAAIGETLAAPPTTAPARQPTTAPGPPPTTAPGPPRVPALWMPVSGAVVRGFDARAGPFGPGHRGIDIAAPVGATVRAPAAGRVAFAGPVAGTTWVSLLVAPGILVTLGPLLDPRTVGRVPSRATVGRVGPGHRAQVTGTAGPGAGAGPGGQPGAVEGATLHLSVRVDGVYVDPLAYLIDRPRPRLAPLPTPGGLPAG